MLFKEFGDLRRTLGEAYQLVLSIHCTKVMTNSIEGILFGFQINTTTATTPFLEPCTFHVRVCIAMNCHKLYPQPNNCKAKGPKQLSLVIVLQYGYSVLERKGVLVLGGIGQWWPQQRWASEQCVSVCTPSKQHVRRTGHFVYCMQYSRRSTDMEINKYEMGS